VVKNAKPRRNRHGVADRTWYPDGDGMYLVVQPAGAKSFALRYRFGGRTRNLKLGDAATSEHARNGALTLAAARVRAAEARHQLERGVDPAAHRAAAHAAPGADDSVEALVTQFLKLHAHAKTRAGSAQATERIFNKIVLPAWRGRSIHGIRRRDVVALAENVATDRPYLANRTCAVLSKFANWLLARDVIDTSFCAGVERPHREVARSHTLADNELRALWLACECEGAFRSGGTPVDPDRRAPKRGQLHDVGRGRPGAAVVGDTGRAEQERPRPRRPVVGAGVGDHRERAEVRRLRLRAFRGRARPGRRLGQGKDAAQC